MHLNETHLVKRDGSKRVTKAHIHEAELLVPVSSLSFGFDSNFDKPTTIPIYGRAGCIVNRVS